MVTTLIKKIFSTNNSSSTGRLKKIKNLPEEQMRKELGMFFYETCLHHAVGFVTEELSKGDSPFRAISRHTMLNEILIVNFWLVEKVVARKNKALMDELHIAYAAHRSGADGQAPHLLEEKYRAYHESWNDFTGHHDQFGMKASQYIFGDNRKIPFAQTGFWLISYTHDTMKIFQGIKKSCRKMEIKI